MYGQFSVRYFCSLFGKSRQAWYGLIHRQGGQQLSDALVLKLVGEVRSELPRVGTRKLLHLLTPQLHQHHITIGRDKLYGLLGRHGYLLRERRRKIHTTNSKHPYRKFPNLIRELVLSKPNRLWVSDITYIRVGQGFSYLSIITDAYSRKIVGYHLHPTLGSEGPIEALRTALRQAKGRHHLIHHSDRGIQYCCRDYVQLLEHHYVRISMTEKGDPYENAIAERVNGILKKEFDLYKTFGSFTQAHQTVEQAISKYNHLRPHASCDYLTPVMAHQQSGWLRKRWKAGPADVDMSITNIHQQDSL